MLEFYQAYTDFRGMMELSRQLLAQVAIDATGSERITYQGRPIDFGNIRALTMRDVVLEFWPQAAAVRRRWTT
jgi:lysyl-tRNA synthetase class 2